MTGKEIREKYLKFFEERGHQILPSASLIPHNDPSILWTAAGMVPFKPFFTGQAVSEYKRATTCQKCIRTPDIEVVGRTARHHTFFEMLGNFSFGDYFKEKAIPWAWEFVTEQLGLPKEKLWITIYLDDDEAFEIWHKVVGIPAERIVRMGKDTNFWEIGVGPCGPCSEIYIDLGEARGCADPDCKVGCDCDRYLEIWNLVFIQFFRDEEGNYSPLKNKGIDTGMGLERVASVLQKVNSNFDTDLFREIMDYTADLAGQKYGNNDKIDLALKVIADHCRAVTFAVSDGALPGNEGRGYVIRRLLRRAVRFGRVLGVRETFLYKVSQAVIQQMQEAYPELKQKSEHILRVIRTEEERFLETLAAGSDILSALIHEAKAAGVSEISGDDAFKLYDTFGFPLELTQEIAEEQGLSVDEAGFTAAMEEQRKRARNARQETEYLSERGVMYKALREELGENRFMGYGTLATDSNVLALLKDGLQELSAVAGEEVEIILDVTPCYAESGGQVADYAILRATDLEVEITSVHRPVEGLIVHRGKVRSGILKRHDAVKVQVEPVRRQEIARNHSATHLLHKALQEVLGDHVNQAGSLVEPDRMRFDFTHYAAVTPEELSSIEQLVNNAVLSNLPIEVFETSLAKAKELGAAALFGEKYGKQVRVVKMGDYSLELCGGTHLTSTAEVGLFKIINETSVGAGLRRIEAVTGQGVLRYLAAKEEQLQEIAAVIKSPTHELVRRVEGLVQQNKALEQEIEALRNKLAKSEVQEILGQVQQIKGVPVLTAVVAAPDMDNLRSMVDMLRDKLGSGVILLGSAAGEKVNLVAAVTKDLMGRGLHAGNLVKEIAKVVGGGGGGRPDMAQAGGKEPSKLEEAIAKVVSVVEAQIK
ncbi:alanine--tRNA ligase [Desulforamulus aeronauticus]|uniref:Alanine--tRNA ligase n=1 Tax=Desulforamulus aeronauticus DSM 10349 TaxID=1121421 RepID=A0A1M6PKP9_9FIRM|nr:alanine--tRNA ligase [Desulforamulus aeronauticus]SHK08465.1 alanyl-tRNA synthetase [Desulforamulus aeronauticus DSM 10349]